VCARDDVSAGEDYSGDERSAAVATMRLYSVTIHYREPAFELRLRRQGPPYRFTFDVRARDERCAVEVARRKFDEMARLSSVGWVREIVRIEVSCRDRKLVNREPGAGNGE